MSYHEVYTAKGLSKSPNFRFGRHVVSRKEIVSNSTTETWLLLLNGNFLPVFLH